MEKGTGGMWLEVQEKAVAAVAPPSSFTIVCCQGSGSGLHLPGKHLFADFFRINMKDLDSFIIGRDRCGSGAGGSVGLLLHALCDDGLLRSSGPSNPKSTATSLPQPKTGQIPCPIKTDSIATFISHSPPRCVRKRSPN
ncbi:hypothetical protein L6452_44231 [Arctium lappa]|uniref:Uncharacterized protein n=1 Tax=Arctium lappa TaxID=4217 RepID=A0ACB8XEJ6_ARCLA|nr:hypothetical protein L6452_44231 [Arctium lappa]